MSPLFAGHIEVDAQRAPDVAGRDTILNRLGGRPTVEAGQHVVRQHRGAVNGAESQDNPFVELRQPHVSQDTQPLPRQSQRFVAHPHRIRDARDAGGGPFRGLPVAGGR